jgi:hypothetical protein
VLSIEKKNVSALLPYFSPLLFIDDMKHFKLSGIFGIAVALVIGAGVFSASLNSCATLNALSGLSRIQFKINDVGHVQIAGVDISNKHSISDFGMMDGINLLAAFNSGRFPLTFTINVAAKNPNAATGNSVLSEIKVSDLPWTLLLNGTPTINGNIGSPVGIPAGGTTMMIPLQVSIDLKQFFGNQNYNDIINLALSLSGQGGASKVQLKTQPTMSTPLGSVKYPNVITIGSSQFSS